MFVVLFIGTGCKQTYDGQQIEQPTADIPVVAIQNLEVSNQPIPIEASGVLTSVAKTKLSFKIGGIVDKLYCSEGQRVKKGQLLAELNTTEIDAQVLKARQGVDKSRRDLERIRLMYRDSVATLEQVQNLETMKQLAEADLEIAQFNQQFAKIVAPANGRILHKWTEPSELVGAGSPIFELATSGRNAFVVRIGIADRDVVRLALNDRAVVRLDAYPDHTFSARVSEIAQAADPRTGVFSVELTVENAQKHTLRDGFIGKVEVFPSQQTPYYKIDMNALVEGYRDRASVYIPVNDTARKVVVRPEHIGPDFFTVSTAQFDLEQSSRIITDGAAYLHEGSPIRLQSDLGEELTQN